jgi:ribosome-associated protein
MIEEKKGEDIILLDISEIASFTDYFIICSGTSDRMLDALSKDVGKGLRKTHRLKYKTEGDPMAGWLVIDLGDIVVHFMSTLQRDYYRLEQLWNEGKVLLQIQ